MAILRGKKKAAPKKAAAEIKTEAKQPINLDKMVEENKTSGTGYQAYIRQRIKKA